MTGTASALRTARQAGVVVGAGAAGALLVGNPLLTGLLVGAVVVLGGLVIRLRRSEIGESRWSATAPVADDPCRAGRGRAGAVVRALGRVERRELLLSPWFGVGLGLCAFMAVAFASGYEGRETWWNVIQDLPFLAHPLVGLTVVAAHRAATRAHRDGTAELYATLPAGHLRPGGVLAAAPVPALGLAIFWAAYLAVVAASGEVGGEVGAGAGVVLVAGVLLATGGVALGVAVGRVARSPLAPVAVLIAIGFASPRLGSGDPGELTTRMLLSTMPGFEDDAPALTWQQALAHVTWLTLLTAATAGLALWRRRPDEVGGTARSSAPALG